MDSFVQDLRYGIRSLAASPTFSVVAVAALALGIGASTAAFAVVDAVMLRPLPYEDPDRLMTVWETSGDWLHNSVSPANFADWRADATSFEAMAAIASHGASLTGIDVPLRLTGVRVTRGFFDILGVPTHLGRSLLDEEDSDGAAAVVVLGYGLWQRAFAADPAVVGTTIALDGRPTLVVGVMPRGFTYPWAGTDFWVPMSFSPEEAARRGFRTLAVVARLAAGHDVASARTEMQTIAARLEAEFPRDNDDVSANVIPLRDETLGPVRPVLLAVLGATGLVLLIACANVAALMLARGSSREGEIAVRAALGAARGRIIRQLLTEGAVLAAIGAAIGLTVSYQGARFLLALIPSWVPVGEPGLDVRVVAFALVASAVTVLVFALAPSLQASRADLAVALRGGQRASGDRRQQRMRSALVVAEVAIAIVLLVGAGLMVRSFTRLLSEETGFDPTGTLTARLTLTSERYESAEERLAFYDGVLEAAATVPAVEVAAFTTAVPLNMSGGALLYTPEGQPTPSQDATFRVVTPGYFRALGIRLEGRDFGPADVEGSGAVAIVGRELATRAWPGESPIGKRLKIGREDSTRPWLAVIGVADDVRQWGVELAARPAVYVAYRQWTTSFFPRDIVLRARGDLAGLEPALRVAVAGVDPDVPVSGVSAMSERVAAAVAARRFNMQLFGLFAGVALSLACLGVYGVIASSVVARTREIGIRVALGAGKGDVLGLLLRQAAALVVVGVGLGLGVAAVMTRWLESLLYEVGRLDPVTFVLVPAALLLAAALAVLVPARRASGIDPLVALKHE